jgi:hypothetical protein
MALCDEARADAVNPSLLEELASSEYRLDDVGWGEDEDLSDFLSDFFCGWHGDIYDVLGEQRFEFEPEFPLFQVIAGAHPLTPHGALERLVSQGDPEVLWAIGGNPRAGDQLLVTLLESWPQAVIEAGIQGLADPQVDETNGVPSIRYGTGNAWELLNVPVGTSVAGNRFIGADLLGWFAGADNPDFAKALILRNGDRLSEAQWRRLFEGTRGKDRFSGGWLQWIANSSDIPPSLIDDVLTDLWEGPILACRRAS